MAFATVHSKHVHVNIRSRPFLYVKYRSSVKFIRATLKYVHISEISANFHVLTLAGSDQYEFYGQEKLKLLVHSLTPGITSLRRRNTCGRCSCCINFIKRCLIRCSFSDFGPVFCVWLEKLLFFFFSLLQVCPWQYSSRHTTGKFSIQLSNTNMTKKQDTLVGVLWSDVFFWEIPIVGGSCS